MIERQFYIYLNENEEEYIKIYDGADALAADDKNSLAIRVFSDEFYMNKEEWEEFKKAGDEYFNLK